MPPETEYKKRVQETKPSQFSTRGFTPRGGYFFDS